MIFFYQKLIDQAKQHGTVDVIKTFQESILYLINTGKNVIDWAPFVFIG
jgi:hypothetical protein